MNVQFWADAVLIQEDDEFVTIAFTDNANQLTEVFALRYALFEDPDQLIYCERNGKSQSCYDGIQQAELSRTTFSIIFNEEGVVRLGCDRLAISFEVDETKFSHLQIALHLMFSHSGVLGDTV